MPSVYSLTFLLWTTQSPNQLLMFIPILIETIALSYQQPVPVAFHPVPFHPFSEYVPHDVLCHVRISTPLVPACILCVFDAKDGRTADLRLWSWDFIIEGSSGSGSGHRPCGPDLGGNAGERINAMSRMEGSDGHFGQGLTTAVTSRKVPKVQPECCHRPFFPSHAYLWREHSANSPNFTTVSNCRSLEHPDRQGLFPDRGAKQPINDRWWQAIAEWRSSCAPPSFSPPRNVRHRQSQRSGIVNWGFA